MKKLKYIVAFWLLAGSAPSGADPVTFYTSFAGNIDFQVTGASLRTQSNNGNACAVTGPGTTRSATLSGIPFGASIQAAYLYWAGSGSTPDTTVTFQGNTITADRVFTETFVNGGTDYDFFSGFADVTGLVSGNGSYGFSGLNVDTGNPYCPVQAVMGGWSLIVVYEHGSEPLRVVNVFDGLNWFRGSRIDLTPSNFEIPAGGCGGTGDCKFGVVTWEGDVENSTSLGGFSENLYINPPPPPGPLTDAVNPPNNQYNSTISVTDVTGAPNTTNSYGLDLDVYSLSTPAHLSPGDTSAVTRYESGADLVLLSAEVFSVRNTPVADLAIDKSHSGDFTAGQQGIYTLSVTNNGPNVDNGPITVSDTLPAGLDFVSATSTDGNWSCGAAGQDVTCTHPGPLAAGNTLADISLTVDVTASAAPSVTNTADVAGASFDNVMSNNSDSDPTNVLIPDLSTSTKSVLDINGGEADPGDVLRYTITLNESNGVAVNNAGVTDTLDSLLENLTIVSIPAGASDNSTPGTGPLDVDGIDLVANGSADIVFEATIAAGANPGDLINNTAVITNPADGSTTDAVAPTVTVSPSSIPAPGVKNLYPYYQSTSLQRIVPTSNQTDTLTGNGDSTTLTLSPQTQGPLTLTAGNIQIPLCMQRTNFNFFNRDVAVDLDYTGASSGSVGSATQTGILNNGAWQLVTFNINLASDINLATGTALTLTITNDSFFNGLHVAFSSTNCGAGDSYVALNSTTLINVDSVGVYDAAYPGGSVQPVYTPGDTVFVRAVVSDPFGSFDITGADIELVDGGGGIAQASTAMTEVNDSGVATKTYEYQYTIPPGATEGSWTTSVTAREGTEGTVTDLRVRTFTVGTPSLSMLKLVSTISDPVNNAANPKAIPGAIVEYSVTVTNSGAGPADAGSVVITDAIPADLTFYFGNPADPVQFVDGSPASGLSFTFGGLGDSGDDIDFSNDGGSTFITPSVDANGFDATTPPIDFIRITPQGTLNGATGSGDPGFTLRYRGRVR